MSTPNEKDPQIVTLKNVRLSYCDFLFTPKQPEVGEAKKPKWESTFILNKKEHAATIKQIEELITRTALDLFKKKVVLKHICIRDGNEKSDTDGYGDEVMFIPARTESRPATIDRDKTPLVEADGKLYAGCYVNATIRLFAYEFKDPKTGAVQSRGVSASLRGVQFLRDGESFGANKVNVDQEFEDVSATAGGASDNVADY